MLNFGLILIGLIFFLFDKREITEILRLRKDFQIKRPHSVYRDQGFVIMCIQLRSLYRFAKD